MYPTLFRIPYLDFPISTFGVMLAIAFLVGSWITAKRMQEEGLDPDVATTLLIYVMLGGLFGSKLYYALDTWLRTGAPFWQLALSRDGITWYGGLIGGTAIGLLGCRIHHQPLKTVADCTAVSGAVGQALGRVGCFLVGDDYGRPSSLPWAVAFPQGSPPTLEAVHPTQLYEVVWLLAAAAFLWKRRRQSPFLFGEYIVLNGLGRIVIESWRVNPKVALGLTEPQWIGLALIVIGISLWLYFARQRRAADAEPVAPLKPAQRR
jgi:phosphatidylglycerol:prolipoprotein diacylglycerol transferase